MEADYGFVIPSALSPSAKRSDLMRREISTLYPNAGSLLGMANL